MKEFTGHATWTGTRDALRRSGVAADALDRLEPVWRFAETAHDGQIRPGGAPYTVHLSEAALILADAGETDDPTLAAALLHDTVEDTAVTVAEVRDRFGEEVATLVDWLTKPSAPATDRRAVRAAYLERFGVGGAPERAVVVKLADRYSNVQRPHPDPVRWVAYRRETLDVFPPIAGRHPYFAELYAAWERRWADLGDR
ncbi:HD domain-containing protein [Nocardiopsis sp. NPDC050513]|uniref:HD domain-containing protein n=1 Tax=Nocardiopsis sp. NPDC050513 TaxID=3364338 RepID=UPI0037A7DE5F